MLKKFFSRRKSQRALTIPTKPSNVADDVSTASTACNSSGSFSIDRTSLHDTKPRRCVSFDLERNTVHLDPRGLATDEELAAAWYAEWEYRDFKASTTQTIHRVARSEGRNFSAQSHQQMFERTYEICCQSRSGGSLSTRDHNNLVKWMSLAPNRWGLETWGVPRVHSAEAIRRKEQIDLIMEVQKSEIKTDRAEYIKRCSECVSRPSRLYAHFVANALAAIEC